MSLISAGSISLDSTFKVFNTKIYGIHLEDSISGGPSYFWSQKMVLTKIAEERSQP